MGSRRISSQLPINEGANKTTTGDTGFAGAITKTVADTDLTKDEQSNSIQDEVGHAAITTPATKLTESPTIGAVYTPPVLPKLTITTILEDQMHEAPPLPTKVSSKEHVNEVPKLVIIVAPLSVAESKVATILDPSEENTADFRTGTAGGEYMLRMTSSALTV